VRKNARKKKQNHSPNSIAGRYNSHGGGKVQKKWSSRAPRGRGGVGRLCPKGVEVETNLIKNKTYKGSISHDLEKKV